MWRVLLGCLLAVGCGSRSGSPPAEGTPGDGVTTAGTASTQVMQGATPAAGAAGPKAAGTGAGAAGAAGRAGVTPSQPAAAAGSGGASAGAGAPAAAGSGGAPSQPGADDADAGSEPGDARDAGEVDAPSSGAPTLHVVGTRRIELPSGNRSLPLQLWYPAAESARASAAAGRPISEFEPAGEKRTQLEGLLAKAPAECVTKTMHAADSPEPLVRSEAFPLVLLSHCHAGTRYGLFTLAERLAAMGFVVAALDHVGDTLYEQLDGTIVLPLGDEVERRFRDLTRLLDVLLDPSAALVPEGLRGKLDARRVGVVGHSIGSISSGRFSWAEPRVRASVFIAAPPTVFLFSPAVLDEFEAPALFVHASEDNSIPAELNAQILTDYRDYPRPAWLVRLTDAGHFAFSDLVGIVPELSPGCGSAMRQTDPRASFMYLDPKLVREVTSGYASAFLARVLLNAPGAELDAASANPKVVLEHHD